MGDNCGRGLKVWQSLGPQTIHLKACLPPNHLVLVVGRHMQFDELLKKQSVTLEESSRICRGAPASGDSPIDGYWSCLCDKPLLRNTGRHVAARSRRALYRPSLCALTTHPAAAAHRARFSPRTPRAVASAFRYSTEAHAKT